METADVYSRHSKLIKKIPKILFGKGCIYVSLEKRYFSFWQLKFLADVFSIKHNLYFYHSSLLTVFRANAELAQYKSFAVTPWIYGQVHLWAEYVPEAYKGHW